ncbi:histidine kinase N-terminal 7TM domain-containing protein [Haloarcula salinisoli]|uniref:PAS domain-containing protein n=1 Tax=Haloarcula salinisoli TaxID=2487746 RepID=A0A8J7YL57_9EURY|nr:histidine kinase N-terminal 7TM domain-containing protein [Halomicroarcula salinisoli]MBX0285334.1 PAS domain-containing protein [Halomicroarcula salinisoli]MBX0303188.1 PAS domain-containing protein [Halomicroarcula salinisoli]
MSAAVFLIGLFASVLVVLMVTVLIGQNQSIPGTRSLLVASVLELYWLLCYAGELFSPTVALTEVFARLEWAGAVFIPLLWTLFVVEYTGRGQYITRDRVAGLAIPPALSLVSVASSFERLVRPNFVVQNYAGLNVVVADFGPIYWLFAVYAWLLVTSSLVLLVEFIVDQRALYQNRAIALLGAGAVPQVASVLNTTELAGPVVFSLTPLTFAISSGLAAVAILEFDAFSEAPVAPHLATETAVEAIEDPTFVLDSNDTVVDANPAAHSLVAMDRESLVGTPRETLAPLAGIDPESAGSTITVERDGEKTYYDAQSTPIDGDSDHTFGTVVTLRDVTDRRERKQRLDALNDVLRATIQEEMTTVQRAVEDADDEVSDIDVLREQASVALGVSDRAGDLAAMVEPEAESPADIVPIIHEEIEAAREWKPEVSFVLDATLGEWAYCSGLFEPVFRVSLRQAAERSLQEVAEPVVGISVDAGPEAVTVSVSDSGPPLTDHERAVLRGETRPRPSDQADMSRWLVNWGIEQADGTIRIGEDGEHTSLELTFPRTDGD